jgi:hypothetical protein
VKQVKMSPPHVSDFVIKCRIGGMGELKIRCGGIDQPGFWPGRAIADESLLSAVETG